MDEGTLCVILENPTSVTSVTIKTELEDSLKTQRIFELKTYAV